MVAKEYTLKKDGLSDIESRRSRFIGFAYPVTSRVEVDKLLNRIRKNYPDSTHIVYAFRLGLNGSLEHFTDDREPAGTAGAPIMRVLTGRNITNAVVIVIRYFGGTKLGMGGLARAYGECARLAIENSGIIPLIKIVHLRAKIPYSAISKFVSIIDSMNGKIVNQKFEEMITVDVKVAEENIEKINSFLGEVTKGKIKLEIIGRTNGS